MRKVLIVGAGQSGLQLGLGLQARGYEVTLVSNRTAEEIRCGRVMSTQCMFDGALALERAQELDLWASEAPRIEGLGISVSAPDARRAIDWVGKLEGYAQSVDQRLKMSRFLDLFEERGGRLVIENATVEDLDRLAPEYDLMLIAAGKGDLVSLFERDASRSPYSAPQRSLAVAYAHGVAPRPEHDFPAVRCNLVPGGGELFVIPCLTLSGPCHTLFWEAIPGGPLDVFGGITDPDEHFERTLELMKRFTPWEYERAKHAELTDANATLSGRFAPTVRRPIAVLPSGTLVLGVADVVVVNDPITGQGSNNAAKCAALYLDSIVSHGDRPFDRDFMQGAFERFWESVAPVTKWTNAMLAPPPEHVLGLIAAGARSPEVANRFANAFDDPSDFEEWFFDPERAAAYLSRVAPSA
ncbi:MAG: FAD-binding oxidoreductase, partial [Polyangiaceae bacterium]|nr:FAD-binding oxidoreductase [Polyangiaceae bacterium]